MSTNHRHTGRSFLQQSALSIGGAVCALAAPRRVAAEVGFRGKFSICNETFGDWPFEKAFAFAAECAGPERLARASIGYMRNCLR